MNHQPVLIKSSNGQYQYDISPLLSIGFKREGIEIFLESLNPLIYQVTQKETIDDYLSDQDRERIFKLAEKQGDEKAQQAVLLLVERKSKKLYSQLVEQSVNSFICKVAEILTKTQDDVIKVKQDGKIQEIEQAYQEKDYQKVAQILYSYNSIKG